MKHPLADWRLIGFVLELQDEIRQRDLDVWRKKFFYIQFQLECRNLYRDLPSRFDSMIQVLDAIDQDLASISQSVASMGQRIEALEQRLDSW